MNSKLKRNRKQVTLVKVRIRKKTENIGLFEVITKKEEIKLKQLKKKKKIEHSNIYFWL